MLISEPAHQVRIYIILSAVTLPLLMLLSVSMNWYTPLLILPRTLHRDIEHANITVTCIHVRTNEFPEKSYGVHLRGRCNAVFKTSHSQEE
jgi:hypothetical protein